MAYRVLALALLLVAFSSGEIHDATENLPNAGDSVELLSESIAAPEAHASPDGKGAEKVNEKGAATEEEAPGTTINEVNKEAAAATEEEAAATTTTNQVNEEAAATEEEAAATTTNNEVNEKAAATEEEAAATTTNKAPVVDHSRDGNVGEVTEIKTMVKMKTTYDPNSTPCPSGFTMQSKTDLGFTTGGHTTQAHGWLCKCTAGCGCVDSDNKPAILTAHVDGSSNTNGISTSNYNTLVDTLQSKVNSFVTSQREAGINSATTALDSCSEERARLGEGVQDRLGSGELKLTTFLPKAFGESPNLQWIIDLGGDSQNYPAVLKVDGHYDWKWATRENSQTIRWADESGISQELADDADVYSCYMNGGKRACFTISVVNPDPFYPQPGMEFKRDDLEAVVNECLQADTIGGYKVLQALKLVGTSGNDDFLGTRQGYVDITNGLPGTKSVDVGSSTAKGMVITYFLKVDGTPEGWTNSFGAADTTCNNAQWRIEGNTQHPATISYYSRLGDAWSRKEEWLPAMRAFREALALAESSNDTMAAARIGYELANVLHRYGDAAAAKAHAENVVWTVLPRLHAGSDGQDQLRHQQGGAFALDALHLLARIYEDIFLRANELQVATGLSLGEQRDIAQRSISCYEALLRQMPMMMKGRNDRLSREGRIVESILRLKTLNTGPSERAILEDAIEGLIVSSSVANDPKMAAMKGVRALQPRLQTRAVATAALRTATTDLQTRVDSLCEAVARDAAINGMAPSAWFDVVVAHLSEGNYWGFTNIEDPMHKATLQLLDLCRHFMSSAAVF